MSTREIEEHERKTLLAPGRVLATLNEDGTRRWLRPTLSPGAFHRWRRGLAYGLMAFFIALPWIHVGGKPIVLLDVPTREFVLLGTTFKPTDTWMFMILLLAVFVGIFLITAVLGRAWCGWACPQTVYLEFLFRPVERLFEGSPQQQALMDKKGGGWRRAAKNLVSVALAAFVAHTFLAYFVGWPRLLGWMQSSPADHPVAFLVMFGTTAAMTFDFLWFREQTCSVVCPYGRFQSVLLDRHSLIVGYDEARGEPRGKPGRQGKQLPVAEAPPSKGDCIDCGACVRTCPTGIDIRDGLQMECVHCTQCIDACDAIMTRVGKPTGLVRYTTRAEQEGLPPRRVARPRVVIYSVVLFLLGTALVLSLGLRGSTHVTILRGIAAPFVELPSGEINNQLRFKVHNRSKAALTYRIASAELAPEQLVAPELPLTVEAGEARTTTIFVTLPQSAYAGTGKRPVTFVVTQGEEVVAEIHYVLLGPRE